MQKKLKRKKIQGHTETISTLSKFRQIIWLVVCSTIAIEHKITKHRKIKIKHLLKCFL